MEVASPSLDLTDANIHSIESKTRSPVYFRNNTGRKVNLLWVDFNGKNVSYGVLNEDSPPLAMNTFVTHPWIVLDEETKLRLWLNAKDVFYPPEPEKVRVRLGSRVVVRTRPTTAFITVPVYNAQRLQDCCCRAISNTRKREEIEELPLPKFLKAEIKEHLKRPGI